MSKRDGHPELWGEPLTRLAHDFSPSPSLMGGLVPQQVNLWMGCARWVGHGPAERGCGRPCSACLLASLLLAFNGDGFSLLLGAAAAAAAAAAAVPGGGASEASTSLHARMLVSA